MAWRFWQLRYDIAPGMPTVCVHESKHSYYFIFYFAFDYKLLTYILHGAVFLDKLTGLQLVNKLPAFYGTRMFVTAFTSARHLSLFWASSMQFIPPHPSTERFILILSSHLRLGLPSGLFESGFPTKTLYTSLQYRHALNAPPISFFSILSPAQYWVRSTSWLISCF
jgi:hypothetical protein